MRSNSSPICAQPFLVFQPRRAVLFSAEDIFLTGLSSWLGRSRLVLEREAGVLLAELTRGDAPQERGRTAVAVREARRSLIDEHALQHLEVWTQEGLL